MPLNLSPPKRKNAISLTPLIDVVFILLLFFMLTSSFLPWRIVETPLSVSTDTPKQTEPKDNVILTLKQNNSQVWVGDQSLSFHDDNAFQKLIAEHNEGVFMVKAEEGVTLQTLMSLADRLKLNGADKISIANAFSMPEKQ